MTWIRAGQAPRAPIHEYMNEGVNRAACFLMSLSSHCPDYHEYELFMQLSYLSLFMSIFVFTACLGLRLIFVAALFVYGPRLSPFFTPEPGRRPPRSILRLS